MDSSVGKVTFAMLYQALGPVEAISNCDLDISFPELKRACLRAYLELEADGVADLYDAGLTTFDTRGIAFGYAKFDPAYIRVVVAANRQSDMDIDADNGD